MPRLILCLRLTWVVSVLLYYNAAAAGTLWISSHTSNDVVCHHCENLCGKWPSFLDVITSPCHSPLFVNRLCFIIQVTAPSGSACLFESPCRLVLGQQSSQQCVLVLTNTA